MNIKTTHEDWTQRNLHNINLVFGACLAIICEYELVKSLWVHPSRNYDPAQIFFLPAFVLLPISFAIAGNFRINKLILGGEMSPVTGKLIRLPISSLTIPVYMGILMLTNIAFHKP